MPRIARFVAPGVAHHITQRGTARQIVFHSRADRCVYLELLREQAPLANVSILAYCLMPNHVHLIAVPAAEDSLAVLLRRVHGHYAQYYNVRRGRGGHLWQNRFYSCPLGPAHLWTALRYVESNPVRACLAALPEEFRWSSAEAHLSGQDRERVLDMRFWRDEGGTENWRRLMGQAETAQEMGKLRRATHAGQPFGDVDFIEQMQKRRRERSAAEAKRKAASAARVRRVGRG